MNDIAFADLNVFVTVARLSSFSAASRELGMSPAYVSKRIAILERGLGYQLFARTSRRVMLTDAGEAAVLSAADILSSFATMRDHIGSSVAAVQGHLHVTASAAFGRDHVAPVLAGLSAKHPELKVRLEIVDRPVELVADDVDVDVRIGGQPTGDEVCHPLARGQRIFCASHDYIARAGEPAVWQELSSHDCLLIRERGDPFGRWSFLERGSARTVNITSALTSNDGAVVRRWALAGRGIMLRSYWDVADDIAAGRLVRILSDCHQEADIYAVTKLRKRNSLRISLCIDALRAEFRSGSGAATECFEHSPTFTGYAGKARRG